MIPLMPTISSAIDEHRAGVGRRRELEMDQAEQARAADRDRADQRALAAPAAVEPGGDEHRRHRDQRRRREQPARDAHAVALGDEVRRHPEQQAEVDQAPGQRDDAESDRLGRGTPSAARVAVPRLASAPARSAPARSRTTQPKRRSTTCASRMRPSASRNLGDSGMKTLSKISASPVGRLRNHRMRQLKIGSSQAEKRARREIAADGAEPADEHQRPAAMLRRHGLGEQRVGHRQHAAGSGAHQEAHADVPPERRHRAADRGADEHHRRQQDRGAPAVEVGEPAPERPSRRPCRTARRTAARRPSSAETAYSVRIPGTTKPRLAGFITSITRATVSTTISRQCAATERRVLGRADDDVGDRPARGRLPSFWAAGRSRRRRGRRRSAPCPRACRRPSACRPDESRCRGPSRTSANAGRRPP